MFRYCFFTLLFITHISLHAGWPCITWEAEKALTLGYRNDTITTEVQSTDTEHIITNDLKGDDIDIIDVGAHGVVRFCDKWLIKGLAEFGWVRDGRFREIDGADASEESKGIIDGGYTRDYSIGVGYSFNYCNIFRFEPTFGYAYSDQEIEMCHIRTNGSSNDTLSDLRYRMRWDGPWLGFQSKFHLSCLKFNIGYEYHWCHWEAKWLLDGDDVSGEAFSDQRRSKDAWGHRAFFEGVYPIYKCWSLGLGFTYQYRETSNGSLIPLEGDFSDVGFSSVEKVKVQDATWTSYQAKLILYYDF